MNRLRGNISERYTNSVLDAHPYPLNVAESPQIPSYSEQLGATIGGPLVIPKIYNGGSKTSFFVNYSMTRGKSPFDSFANVPTPDFRNGNFSALLNTAVQLGTDAGGNPIYEGAIIDPTTQLVFPNNIIPQGRMDNPNSKAALGLLPYIPPPNLPGSVQNFHLQESLPTANDRIMGRIGHQISAKDSLNAMYYFNSSRSQSVSTFPALTSTSSVRGQNMNLTEIHTLGPRTVNTLTANFNRQRTSLLDPFAYKQNIEGDLGIQGIATAPLDWGLPALQFTNFGALNEAIPSLTRNQTFRVVDIFLRNVGRHNLRMGGELRRVQQNTLRDPNARGTFTFSGYTTSDFNSYGSNGCQLLNGCPVSNTGFDFADFSAWSPADHLSPIRSPQPQQLLPVMGVFWFHSGRLESRCAPDDPLRPAL